MLFIVARVSCSLIRRSRHRRRLVRVPAFRESHPLGVTWQGPRSF